DVESMIRDLTELAITMVKSEQMEAAEPKAKANAEERILDILVPPMVQAPRPPPPMMFPGVPVSSTISGMSQTQQHTPADVKEQAEVNEYTRNRFREKLRAGEM